MHDAQDNVKAFHSKLLLCEVLQEREAQMQMRKEREQQEKEIEHGWLENDIKKMQEYDQRMQARIADNHQRKQHTAQVVK